jgi:rubrerythrin
MKRALIGGNRTGTSRAPELAAAMMEAAAEFPPSSTGDAGVFAAMRVEYARSGEPVGSMPAPTSVKQAAVTGIRAATGGQPQLFLDKLGERLAFERTGTRLYEALVGKADAPGGRFKGGPSRADLVHLQDQELEHAHLLEATIRRLGGDPTVLTPSANLHATASKGIPAVLADPRTTLRECLEAILVAELADNDCWNALVELAQHAGDEEAVGGFTRALAEEREHLERVRTWLAAAQGRSVAAVRMLSAAEREATAALRSGAPSEAGAPPARAARAAARSRQPAARRGAKSQSTGRTKMRAEPAAKRGSGARAKHTRKKAAGRRRS